jgi:hypothetical protein
MQIPDALLLVVFGILSLSTLAAAVFCFRMALRVSGQRDGDLKMFAWAFGSFIGLILSGMSAAYILVPILFGR